MPEQTKQGNPATAAQGAPVASQTVPTPSPAMPEPVVPVVPAPVAPQPATAPTQDLSDRTREQFDKLLETNRNLQNELIRRTQANQTFAPIQDVPPTAPTIPEPNVADFTRIDPLDGQRYIDEDKLKKALTQSNQAAQESRQIAERAEQAAKQYVETANQREVDRQNKETFGVYPMLDPKNKDFDQRFNAQVRGILTDSYLNTRDYGGRPLSFLEAAQFVKGNPEAPTTVAPTTQGAPASQTPAQPTAQELKQQASLSVPSQPQQVLPSSADNAEIQALGMKTRLGDDNALAERLKYTEHILPKEAE